MLKIYKKQENDKNKAGQASLNIYMAATGKVICSNEPSPNPQGHLNPRRLIITAHQFEVTLLLTVWCKGQKQRRVVPACAPPWPTGRGKARDGRGRERPTLEVPPHLFFAQE